MSGIVFDAATFRRLSDRFLSRLDDASGPALRRLAADTIAHTARAWPVDTGRSRAAWSMALQEAVTLDGQRYHEVIVTNPVSYAPLIEYGTASTPAGRYLQQAIRTARRDFLRDFSRTARRAWEGR